MNKKCSMCGETANRFRDASDDPGVRATISFLWELGRWKSSAKKPSRGDVIKCAELICPVCYVEVERMLQLNCFQNPLMRRFAASRGWKGMTSNGVIPHLNIRSNVVERSVGDLNDPSSRIVGRLRDCGKHCFCCGLLFTDEMEASSHINQKHSRREPLRCAYCPENCQLRYMNLDTLKQHAFVTHFSPEYTNGSSSALVSMRPSMTLKPPKSSVTMRWSSGSLDPRLLKKCTEAVVKVKRLTEEEIKNLKKVSKYSRRRDAGVTPNGVPDASGAPTRSQLVDVPRSVVRPVRVVLSRSLVVDGSHPSTKVRITTEPDRLTCTSPSRSSNAAVMEALPTTPVAKQERGVKRKIEEIVTPVTRMSSTSPGTLKSARLSMKCSSLPVKSRSSVSLLQPGVHPRRSIPPSFIRREFPDQFPSP